MVPQILTYSAQNYQGQYSQKVVNFTKIGAQEYVQFLQQRDFLTSLKTGRVNINGFVQEYPVVMNEGALDGRYRWVYQTHVMVTYYESDAESRDELEAGAVTKEYELTMQVGRVKEAKNEHGVLIETWSVKEK